jgi:hypothetical protein
MGFAVIVMSGGSLWSPDYLLLQLLHSVTNIYQLFLVILLKAFNQPMYFYHKDSLIQTGLATAESLFQQRYTYGRRCFL